MYAALRGNVGMLANCWAKTTGKHLGEEFLDKIENIRRWLNLPVRVTKKIDKTDIYVIKPELMTNYCPSRAFSQFLNLANEAGTTVPPMSRQGELHKRARQTHWDKLLIN